MKSRLVNVCHRYGPPLAVAGAALLPRLAMAQIAGGGASIDPTTFVQNIVTFLSGPFGQTVFVLAIIICGFVGWWAIHRILGVLVGIVLGAVLVFGGAYLANLVNGASGAIGG